MKRILFLSVFAALLGGCIPVNQEGEGSTTDTVGVDSVDNVVVADPELTEPEPEPEPPFTSPEFKAEPVTIEGILKMYFISVTGDGDEVDTYIEGDWENTCLVFAIVPDKPFDVRPYLTEEIDDEWVIQERFSLLAGKRSYRSRAFAKKYANKRVRITGTFIKIDAGWRYVSEVGLQLDKIELVK